MKTMIADDCQLGLRVMDAVEGPEKPIGVLQAVIPIAHEIRNHDYRDHLQHRRHRSHQIQLQPWRVCGDEPLKRLVHPYKEEEVVETTVIENEIKQVDPEVARAITDAPVLARGYLEKNGDEENQA